MAGILAVYALVVSVLIAGSIKPDTSYGLFNSFLHLAAGLSVGLTGLAAGYAIGAVGDAVGISSASWPAADRNRA
jgi:V-type H+-transporting ATPase proteolipid subunit